MPPSARPLARAGLGLLMLALVPARAPAQSRVQVAPSVALVQVYDDNIFSTPDRQPDEIWRLSPRLGVVYHPGRLTLGARFGLDAEVFRLHPELNTAAAAREATLDLAWASSRMLAASAKASYAEAQSPGELNLVTGLEAGRFRARRLSATLSLSRRLGARTKATLEPSFTREQTEHIAGDRENDIQALSLGLERRLGEIDRCRLSYGARRFAFGREPTVSHVLTVGWSREVTPLAHFEFEAGPRLSGHAVGAELVAAIKHRFRRGEAGLVYLHTQTTVLGQPGPLTAEGATATLSHQLLRSLRVGGGPAVFRVRGADGSEAMIHRWSLEIAWRATRRLSVTASDHFGSQHEDDGRQPAAYGDLTHNTFLLSVAATSARN